MEQAFRRFHADWNVFIRDVLGVRLDKEQQEIVSLVQHNRRTSVRSGHARGKDYVASAIALTFLNLYIPSKVIVTAPSGRQVEQIMMAEITTMHRNAKFPLGGKSLTTYIKMPEPNWYLMGFKTTDARQEMWTGFHSPHILVIVSEASGVDDSTFSAIQGLLTGTIARLLVVFNPTQKYGEAYQSVKNPMYKTIKMCCLDAVNVKEKRIVISGQVDWQWVNDMVRTPGMTVEIPETEMNDKECDFRWEGKCYRPSDMFRVKVLGEFPKSSEGSLIPLEWIELAMERYEKHINEALELVKKYEEDKDKPGLVKRYYGVDVAGMGRDLTVMIERIIIPEYNIFDNIQTYAQQDHMMTAGRVKALIDEKGGIILIDALGEGAGVNSRLIEQSVPCIGVKFSESAKGLTDITGMRTFYNMRAYCWWSIRDILDPSNPVPCLLPRNKYLTQDLTEPNWHYQSDGSIILEPKDDIKARMGRSPDYGDAAANTTYPYTGINILFL